jgi:hypothetical protein
MSIALEESLQSDAYRTASREQLRLALDQGEAYQHALEAMIVKVADDGQEQRVQDYVVTYAVEPAEGVYELVDDEWHWREPQNENIYLQISIRDASDHRFVPGLIVYATLTDSAGNIVGIRRQPFVWHPWLYHYGGNWRIPKDGQYTLKVRVEAPAFQRRDKKCGQRYLESAEVEFRRVNIDTGRKYS